MYILHRKIIKPIEVITHQMKKISEGETNINLLKKVQDDEIGHLIDAMAAFKNNAELLIKQNVILEEAKKNAESSDKLKSEFLACMSHEIRTPLNGVIGMLSILGKSDLNEKQSRTLGLARTSAHSLLTIINEILDFSKIDANRMTLESIDFDLRILLDEIASTLSLEAAKKSIEVVVDCDGHVFLPVRGDLVRVRQIFTNLFSNALKFTEKGYIKLGARLEVRPQGKVMVSCFVEDSGIGIPKEKQIYLFDAFSQVDASTTRKYGGTGLGLAIVKKLCSLMGGDIYVTSEEGNGSRFSFNLLLQESDALKVPVQPDLSGKSVLVFEESFLIKNALSSVLTAYGADVQLASSQSEAVDILSMKESGEIDLFFVGRSIEQLNDFLMHPFLVKHREQPSNRLILLTDIYDIVSDEFETIGVDDYLRRNISVKELNLLLEKIQN